MNIIPAIDLINRTCVRLCRGDFDQKTEYRIEPIMQIKQWQNNGVSECHIVDLDGARQGEPVQLDFILNLKSKTNITIQLGGGFRDAAAIANALDKGIDRIVIGSLAVTQPEIVCDLIQTYGVERFVLAFDIQYCQVPKVAINGWKKIIDLTLWECLNQYQQYDGLRILCTDIGRDGLLCGPNFQLYREIIRRYPQFELQASGGVGTLQDLQQCYQQAIPNIIIGKALYENRFSISKARQELGQC